MRVIPAYHRWSASAGGTLGSDACGGIEQECGIGIGGDVRTGARFDDRSGVAQQQPTCLPGRPGGSVRENQFGERRRDCDVHVIRR